MSNIGENYKVWDMPYLPINPADLGESYEAIIRVNSQSGKGGVSYILEQSFGIRLFRPMQQEFGGIATKASDEHQKELSPEEIRELFDSEYINIEKPYSLISFKEQNNGVTKIFAVINASGEEQAIEGEGGGLIDAFCKALSSSRGVRFDIADYSQHSLDTGKESRAISYVHIVGLDGKSYFGSGISHNISRSSIRAVISAVNRMVRK
jgi:2-isopropylmalate synthase